MSLPIIVTPAACLNPSLFMSIHSPYGIAFDACRECFCILLLAQEGQDGGRDKKDKPNWWSYVAAEFKSAPLGLIGAFMGGVFWLFQREVDLNATKLRLEVSTRNYETRLKVEKARLEMMTRLLDMEYHEDYMSWRGKSQQVKLAYGFKVKYMLLISCFPTCCSTAGAKMKSKLAGSGNKP